MPQSDCLDFRTATCSSTTAEEQTPGFKEDVIEGLSRPDKQLHCKYLYDELGSRLFDEICELPEYYPTRTEAGIMADNADAIGDRIGEDAVLVEYGSGSSTKTRLLLDHLSDQRAYLPVDISDEHLIRTAERLRIDYPSLDIHPIVADFTAGFDLPEEFEDVPVTVYFPGSTIGNLDVDDSVALLSAIAKQCHSGGGLLIGFDLDKSREKLVAAYDDSAGVTAKFNLNLLTRINRELDADFNLSQFRHVAIYNPEYSRIEIYIESLTDQCVMIGDADFSFGKGERILTEYSHKYSIERFAALAAEAGFVADECWTDTDNLFAVMHLSLQ